MSGSNSELQDLNNRLKCSANVYGMESFTGMKKKAMVNSKDDIKTEFHIRCGSGWVAVREGESLQVLERTLRRLQYTTPQNKKKIR